MKFKDKLIEMKACPDAIKWVGRRGLKKAWVECERGDWMLWLALRFGVDRKLLVLAACDCAEPALKFIPKDELRLTEAIKISRLWCEGKATITEVRAAAYAGASAKDIYAAAAADTYAAAADNVYAHAYAVSYAVAAATYVAVAAAYANDDACVAAASDATAAAYAAASDDATNKHAAAYAARTKVRKTQANIIRKRIPYEILKS